jgi:hypothetical protein
MTDEAKKEEAKIEAKPEPQKAETPTPLSVRQIFDAYPNDRQKAIDYIFMGVQNDLNRIANSLEYLARRKQIQDPIAGLDTSPADAPPKDKE